MSLCKHKSYNSVTKKTQWFIFKLCWSWFGSGHKNRMTIGDGFRLVRCSRIQNRICRPSRHAMYLIFNLYIFMLTLPKQKWRKVITSHYLKIAMMASNWFWRIFFIPVSQDEGQVYPILGCYEALWGSCILGGRIVSASTLTNLWTFTDTFLCKGLAF